MDKFVQKTKELLAKEPFPLPFGPSNRCSQSQEGNCKFINVFMMARGLTYIDRRRTTVPPSTTLRELRLRFGREFDQQLICDENSFRFAEDDLDMPISNFSRDCNLNVSFEYEDHIEEGKKRVSSVMPQAPRPPKPKL